MYATVEGNDHGWLNLPTDVLRQFRELAASVDKRSQIVWAEHCSECAFPSCYSTCAFYTPRRDLHCRRFEDGIRQDDVGGVQLGRIRLRKWAKLEGVGPARLIDTRQARIREAIDRSVSALITKAPLSQITYARACRYWNDSKSPQGPSDTDHVPDAFVVETWLATGPAMVFTLTILPTGQRRKSFFQRGLTIEAAYNRIVVPRAEIAAHVDIAKPYLIQFEPVEDASGRELVLGVMEFVRFKGGQLPAAIAAKRPQAGVSAFPSHGRQRRLAKCVVWDLDNTVWNGTLAEDGQDGLQLKPEVAAIMVELDRRGILQSVASKNDAEPALAALEVFGLRQYLLFPQVGWGPKSDSLRRIAELLDIGLDTFVFIDDEAFERGEVGAALPMVTVVAEKELPSLLSSPLFDVPATAEGSKRRAMYQLEEVRQATFASSGTDYLTFLRDCNIRLTVYALSEQHAERAYELSQRTNQLNFSGTKYARSDIVSFLQPDCRESVFLLRCADKFGDYGIIGMCVLDAERGHVLSFMMSCRVQRKRVEAAFFSWLARRIAADRAELVIAHRKTPKNGASVRMLEELGFEFRPARDPEEGLYTRSAQKPFADDDVVLVDDRTKVVADVA